MISVGLLSEVLGENIVDIIGIDKKRQSILYYLTFGWKYVHSDAKEVNIYELSHKCKEWAFKEGYWLDSGKERDNWRCFVANKVSGSMMRADSEPEAIFKACQLILDYKAKR